MHIFRFETSVIARRGDGMLLIALIDGDELSQKCVGIYLCTPETAKALRETLGSTLDSGT